MSPDSSGRKQKITGRPWLLVATNPALRPGLPGLNTVLEDEGIANRPGALDRLDYPSALRRLGIFRHEHRASGPFAAKAKALQRPEDQELLVRLRAAGEKRE